MPIGEFPIMEDATFYIVYLYVTDTHNFCCFCFRADARNPYLALPCMPRSPITEFQSSRIFDLIFRADIFFFEGETTCYFRISEASYFFLQSRWDSSIFSNVRCFISILKVCMKYIECKYLLSKYFRKLFRKINLFELFMLLHFVLRSNVKTCNVENIDRLRRRAGVLISHVLDQVAERFFSRQIL